MTQFQTVYVFPSIPEPLLFLDKLSRNLWWSWQRDAVELFRRIDPRLWRESNGNPLYFSTLIPQERLQELSQDESFLAHQARVEARFESMLHAPMNSSSAVFGDKGNGCLFFHGIRHSRKPSAVCRRSGHAGRGPFEIRIRPAGAADRRRPLVPAGIFSSISGPERMAAGRISRKPISIPSPWNARWIPGQRIRVSFPARTEIFMPRCGK